jgi:hypothetical protein
MIKKIFLVFLSLAVLSSSLLTPVAKAQTGSWYSPNFFEFYDKVYNTQNSPESEIFGERYTAAQVNWIMWSVASFFLNLTGIGDAVVCITRSDITNISDCIADLITSGFNPNNANSLLAKSNNSLKPLSIFSNHQVSSIGYLLGIGERLKLVPEAKAQGFGYATGGGAVQLLWRTVRDVSYTFLIIAIVVMAFMIMFRTKISPQTVITVQSALPRIVIALILITFSYAIAGFLIDLMYVVMGIMVAVIMASDIMTGTSWPVLFSSLAIPDVASVIIIPFSFLVSFCFAIAFALMQIGGSLCAPGISSAICTIAGGVVGGFVGVVFLIIGFFSIVIAAFKIISMLFKAFVNILLLIVIGPLQILMGSISNYGGFGQWLKNLIGELTVFPLAVFLFILAFFFLAGSLRASNYAIDPTSTLGQEIINDFFVPPFNFMNADFFIANGNIIWSPPLTVGANASGLLWLMVSWVVLAMIPKTAEIVKGAMSGKPFSYGAAIGEFHEAGGRQSVQGRGTSVASGIGRTIRSTITGKSGVNPPGTPD